MPDTAARLSDVPLQLRRVRQNWWEQAQMLCGRDWLSSCMASHVESGEISQPLLLAGFHHAIIRDAVLLA